MLRSMAVARVLSTCAVLAVAPLGGQSTSSESGRHWTVSALGGLSTLALGGGGAAEVWSRVGRVRGGEGLFSAVDYGGRRWSAEISYGQGHASIAEFTANMITISISARRHLEFASTSNWQTRLGLGFVRTGLFVPPIRFSRFRLEPSEVVGSTPPWETSGDQFLGGVGIRTEVGVLRHGESRLRPNVRVGLDLSRMPGTTSSPDVPLLTQWGRMTSVYLRFGFAFLP